MLGPLSILLRLPVTLLGCALYLVRPEEIGRSAAPAGEPERPEPPLESSPPSPRRRALGRAWRLASSALTLAAVVAWLLLLRPDGLGGPASYVFVSGNSMEPTLSDGDLVMARRETSYAVGDVVVYRIPRGELGAGALVIHRIVGGNGGRGYATKGDNRRMRDEWRPKAADVLGRRLVDAPYAGRAFAAVRAPLPMAFLAAALTFLSVANEPRKRGSTSPGARAPRRRSRRSPGSSRRRR
jgi:signal peptidase I